MNNYGNSWQELYIWFRQPLPSDGVPDDYDSEDEMSSEEEPDEEEEDDEIT